MTLPDERTRALQYGKQFLLDLLDPKKTPKVPKNIRRRAYACLRHWPFDIHLEDALKHSKWFDVKELKE
jgi:hypothetical protein